MQLHIYGSAIRILAKGYQPISLLTPLELKEILSMVINTVRKTIQIINLIFSYSNLIARKRVELQAGLKPAPLTVWVSARPLVHLHSMLSPCLNSYPRALLCV